ncbi:MAG: alpha/beta hydrolase-fold protein [Pedobacter sp.]|nr:alpha/beta hydrolase-fold protein [Pedobacter sp.]MDQ8052977.1 alpha/beta hydrolase-fold protein [Pedobacter sp.]
MKRRLLALLCCALSINTFAQQKITVQLAPNLHGPYKGRLIIYMQADTSKPFGQAAEGPAFAIDVKDWKNEESRTLDKHSIRLNRSLDSLKGAYKLVAILDTNMQERGTSASGNLYTREEIVGHFGPGNTSPVTLTLSNVFPVRKFNESDSVKEVVFRSKLLSTFRKQAIEIKAGVILPPSYHRAEGRIYPVVYIIPGWGGTHHHAYNKGQKNSYGIGQGEEKIYVFLNPETQTPYGLHAFVDSRVNGPWGTALVKELLPFISKNFRASKQADSTFITGQSSGGYGAIWLALHFPASFGGCWATSPDPIDFSNFTGVDIYRDDNYYVSPSGEERGIFFVQGKATSSLRNMAQKEQLEGDGGQQQSFEAEFGLPSPIGRPIPLFNPQTGIIDHRVASSWKPYDLALYVRQNWQKIRKDAANKIRIYAGENDNFLLQQSVIAFGEKAKKEGAEIKVELIKGADHFSTRNTALTKQIQAEMDRVIQKR